MFFHPSLCALAYPTPRYLNRLPFLFGLKIINSLHYELFSVNNLPEFKNELNQIKKASDHIPVLLSYNLSTGIHKLKKILKKFLSDNNDLFDCKIIDIHHKNKIDSPSGTAIEIKKIIDSNSNNKIKSIDIDSFREGEFYGIHEIIFSNEKQTINFKHEALSRKIFADGAISIAKSMTGISPGMYTTQDFFK